MVVTYWVLTFRVILLIIITNGLSAVGKVSFTSQPQNVTVINGGDAYFPCTYNGTDALPHWRIAGRNYSLRKLPSWHTHDSTGLTVTRVNSSMHMWSYTCYVLTFAFEEFIYLSTESSTGFLTVINVSALSSTTVSTKSFSPLLPTPSCVLQPCAYSVITSTQHMMLTSVNVVTLDVSVMEKTSSQSIGVSTKSNNTQEQILSKTIMIIVFSCTGIGCIVLGIICVTCIALWGDAYKKIRKEKNSHSQALPSTSNNGNSNNEPVYEEIISLQDQDHSYEPVYNQVGDSQTDETDITMAQNESYGRHKKIRMKECPAYNTVTLQSRHT